MTNPPTNLTLDSGPRDDDERMVRYIVGECSQLESARTQEWIAAEPARWKRFQELERIWRACASEPSSRWDAESALGQLRGSPALPTEPGERSRPPVAPLTLRRGRGSSRSPWNRGALGIAAAIALAAAGVVGSRAITGHWPVRTAADGAAEVVPLQEVATARGQRATITLSDGTRIILGAESSVRYARDFGARARRDVYLDGQAYFEVAHDSLRPLAVHTSRGVAEDLGTEFVVTAYSAMPDMQVVVASGQVLLRHAASSGPDSAIAGGDRSAEPLTLGPGELGIIDSNGALSRSRVSDPSPYFDWTKGELAFRGVPLGEALPAIGRWYDMEIALGDSSLASRRLVASFGPHSAHDVVRLIALAVDARYEAHGDTMVLLPR
ncbi:MAG TPA: FecR domain-containing protein [Gemmatimonadaceae bacterium]|nr:FecR domain-containing protein [Gemmatimonadaceae bacterium]